MPPKLKSAWEDFPIMFNHSLVIELGEKNKNLEAKAKIKAILRQYPLKFPWGSLDWGFSFSGLRIYRDLPLHKGTFLLGCENISVYRDRRRVFGGSSITSILFLTIDEFLSYFDNPKTEDI